MHHRVIARFRDKSSGRYVDPGDACPQLDEPTTLRLVRAGCLLPSGKPCVPGTPEERSCLFGLLLGVSCCPDGSCVLCFDVERDMRRAGFSEDAISQSLVRTWFSAIEVCPVCAFPPPPPLRAYAPLPRFLRVHGATFTSATCAVCSGKLTVGQRRYCSAECWVEFKRQGEEPPPVSVGV